MPHKTGWAGVPALMIALDVVGSDPEHFECPHCGANDRERHLLLYLEASGLLAGMRGKSILHFAPEKRLARIIRAGGLERYVSCDLYPQSADILRVDILAMQFDAGSFDIVIANHVLEHVADEMQALREIRRVLKVGGLAILQTPYSRKLHRTWQDAGIDDDLSRLQAYGQADHVRLFGRDIFDRLASAGFVSKVRQHADLLPHIDAAKAGINPDEPFFLFQRTPGE